MRLRKLAGRPWLVFLLVCFFLRLFAALCPLTKIDAVPMPDDAYISLGLARSIAAGHGPFFGGAFTNGFQPLYVFLLVPFFWLFPENPFVPVHLALVLLVLFDTLALFLLVRLLEKLQKAKLTLVLVAASWAFNQYRIQMAINGLETVISMFFIIASFSFYIKITAAEERNTDRRSYFYLGLLLGTAMLARVDNAILAFVLFIALAVRLAKRGVPLKTGLEKLAWLCGGGFLAYVPWLAYSYYYTGQIVPVSGKAVRLLSMGNIRHRPPFINEALAELVSDNFLLIAVSAALLLMLFIIPGRSVFARFRAWLANCRTYLPLLAFGLILTLAYVYYAYGFWAYFRYLYPVSLLFLIYMGETIDIFLGNLSSARLKALGFSAILAVLVTVNVLSPAYYRLFIAKRNDHYGYMKLGLWARDHFADGTVVGSGQTGALGYYAGNLKVINLDGVVNRASYTALRNRRFLAYARRIGLQFIIGWDSEIRYFKRSSRPYRKGELVFVRDIHDFKSFNHRPWQIYQVNLKFRPVKRT